LTQTTNLKILICAPRRSLIVHFMSIDECSWTTDVNAKLSKVAVRAVENRRC
jgi:hypothetical protein